MDHDPSSFGIFFGWFHGPEISHFDNHFKLDRICLINSGFLSILGYSMYNQLRVRRGGQAKDVRFGWRTQIAEEVW